MTEIVTLATEALDNVTNWKRDVRETRHEMRAFMGNADGWHFVIVDFSITEQGFPDGSRGVDGMARHDEKSLVLRLPRELAQTGLDLALEVTRDSQV